MQEEGTAQALPGKMCAHNPTLTRPQNCLTNHARDYGHTNAVVQGHQGLSMTDLGKGTGCK